MPKKKFTSRFDQAHCDPRTEAAVASLVRFTSRVSILLELLGATEEDRTPLNKCVVRHIDDLYGPGSAVSRPRGLSCQYTSQSFLPSIQQRREASILLGLHVSAPLKPGAALDGVFPDVYARIDMLVAVYGLYCSKMRGDPSGRLSFDAYMQLLKGIQSRALHVATCKCCGARHVYNPVNVLGNVQCPWCQMVNMDKVRAELDKRPVPQTKAPMVDQVAPQRQVSDSN